MPKQKTHRGAAKRFKLTAKGKVVRSHSNHGHMFTGKPRKRKRRLAGRTLVDRTMLKTIRRLVRGAGR